MAKTIDQVTASGPQELSLTWSDGSRSTHNLRSFLERKAIARPLLEQTAFATVARDPEGFFVFWPGTPVELSTDWFVEGGDRHAPAASPMSAEEFAGWIDEMNLTVSEASGHLGVSVRQIRYYLSGGQPVPKKVFLACMHLAAARARDLETAAVWHAAGSISEFETRHLSPLTRSGPIVSNDNRAIERIKEPQSTQELNYA